LNLEAINQLLHPTKHDLQESTTKVHKSFSTSDIPSTQNVHDDDTHDNNQDDTAVDHSLLFPPTKKLVGGRAAIQESTRVPFLHISNNDHHLNTKTQSHKDDNATTHNNNNNNNNNNNIHTPIDENKNEHNANNMTSSTTANVTETNANTETPSFIDDFFSMDIETKTTCDSCHYTRTRIETNRHLSLLLDSNRNMHPIGHSSNQTRLQDALRDYFTPQSCHLKCERCFGDSATQTMQLIKLPKTLLFHISRFTLTQTSTSFSYTKNTNSIELQHNLSYHHHHNQPPYATCCPQPEDEQGILNEFVSPHVQVPPLSDSSNHFNYQLCGIVNHIGSSAEYGHYTADAVRNKKDWFRFNDEMVTPLRPGDALQNKSTAYLVMYSLEENEQ